MLAHLPKEVLDVWTRPEHSAARIKVHECFVHIQHKRKECRLDRFDRLHRHGCWILLYLLQIWLLILQVASAHLRCLLNILLLSVRSRLVAHLACRLLGCQIHVAHVGCLVLFLHLYSMKERQLRIYYLAVVQLLFRFGHGSQRVQPRLWDSQLILLIINELLCVLVLYVQ